MAERFSTRVICNETNVVYDSIRQAARAVGVDHTRVLRALKRKSYINGMTFSFVDEADNTHHENAKSVNNNEQTTWDEGSDKATYTYKGIKVIKTLEDALEVADVDLNVWEVDRWLKNSWDVTSKGDDGKPQTSTNHQVKIWFKRRAITDVKILLEDIPDKIYPIQYVKESNGICYLGLADFHIGALVQGLKVTEPFSTSILVNRLQEISDYINSKRFQHVHVGMLGDFIESFTGLNHLDSWKSMHIGSHGSNIVIAASEIISYFLSTIRNLSTVNMVSGNHDRVHENKGMDNEGQVGDLLHYILKMKLPDATLRFDNYVLRSDIDDVCYVQTHGHHGVSKNAMADILFNYGDQNKYNVIVQGHFHSRGKKDAYRVSEGTILDRVNYRSIVLPPLFTGNSYSERSGWSSSAGFNILYKNHKGFLTQEDVML